MHPSAPGNEAACLTFSRPGEGCCGAPRPLIRPPNAPHCPSRGRRATNDQTFEGRKENLNQANKLSRTFATLLEGLNRHRGKGQQKMTVEHVHVHEGGQAIVGSVETQGGGFTSRSEGLPHAKQIAHAPDPPVPSKDTSRDGVPVSDDAERSVPNARRDVTGPTEGE
jgi:hypothetical protein